MDIEKYIPGTEYNYSEKRIHDGIQGLVRFPNNYGASIIHHSGSYGVELAVIHYDSNNWDDWDIDYSTPITDDVMGWLDEETLGATLLAISTLPNYYKELEN